MLRINGVEQVPNAEERAVYTPVQAVAKTEPERAYGPFIASKERNKFHRPSCEWARKILRRNKLVFSSHTEAAKYFKPCGQCRA